ncbi:hypothetical protein FPV67DRAFT_1460745 [Lyophyllum atratum]|nr:hypothetical protein FPV67DRAFT_1460745 [Lyophyllum atratum]
MGDITPGSSGSCHTGLCFEDGNVILRADTASACVHRSVLAYHSPVFRRLWTEAPRGQKVPILLLDDPSNDLVVYINAVYNINSGVAVSGPIPLAEVGCLLRMGRKYAHVGMFASMADRVIAEYPAALSAWEYARLNPCMRISPCVGLEFELLGMAYANDLYAVVPPLLYDMCSRFSAEQLKAGLERTDGSVVRISWRDQVICNVGRDRLVVAQEVHTFGWVRRLPLMACATPFACERFAASIMRSFRRPVRRVRALEVWNDEWDVALCGSCGKAAERMHAAGRRHVWGNLPAYFDLGNWDDVCLLQDDLCWVLVHWRTFSASHK